MNTIIKFAFLLLFLAFYNTAILAQAPEPNKEKVVVVLKSGTMFEGKVQKWVYGQDITIITDSGNLYTFPSDDIEKIVQKHLLDTKTPYNFKEQGRYYSVRAQYINGNFGQRAEEQEGVGVSVLVGQRYNRYLGVGIGVGYDEFILESGEKLAPIFLEASGYLNESHTSLSYSLAAGYSLAFKDEAYNITAAKGGLMVYPTVGVRLGKGKVKYVFDLGYKFQKASFTYANQWDRRSRSEQRLLYQRATLRFGILF